jgi:hypothetical protein
LRESLRLQGSRLAAALTVCLASAAALGHHSFPGIYDTRETLVLEGTVTKFLFRNPHAFITVEIAGDDVSPEVWDLEMPPRWALERRGMTDSTVSPGDRLLVVCNPARDGGRSCGLGQRGGFYRESDGYVYGVDPRTVD